ncbi:MAG: hypothetical protein K8S87_04235 [Planctomycetes bacterium]|nr:hypothetical protein [Planctomycetota bacterium]
MRYFSRLVGIAIIAFILITLKASANDDVYSLPMYKIKAKINGEIWRSPIVFDNVGKCVYFVKPGAKGFASTTTLWKFNVDTNEQTQLSAEIPGRFAYPAIFIDGKKLVCQLQRGKATADAEDASTFSEHILCVWDLSKKDVKASEIDFELPKSAMKNEMMPEISDNGSKLILGVGKFTDISNNDEICHLRIYDFGKKQGYSLLKSIENNKCIEFSPMIMRSTGDLISLMNPKPEKSSISVYMRKMGDSGKYLKIQKIYEPGLVGVFTEHSELPLDARWLNASRYSQKIACQVGGWNLFSIVIIELAGDRPETTEILRGTKTHSFMHPCISPSGQWLAYEKCEIEMLKPPILCAKIKSHSIHLLNLKTMETRKLADASAFPVFSPDASKIAYFDISNEKWTLKVADTDIKAEEQGLLSRKDLEIIEDLVGKLGNDDYKTRETAKIALMRFGKSALNRLIQLEKSITDPEIRYRLREIIEFMQTEIPVVPK